MPKIQLLTNPFARNRRGGTDQPGQGLFPFIRAFPVSDILQIGFQCLKPFLQKGLCLSSILSLHFFARIRFAFPRLHTLANAFQHLFSKAVTSQHPSAPNGFPFRRQEFAFAENVPNPSLNILEIALPVQAAATQNPFCIQPERASGFTDIRRIAAPRKVLQSFRSRFQHSGPDRIQMDIVADCPEIARLAGIHDDGFVAPLKQMSAQMMSGIEPGRVCSLQPTHAINQPPAGCFQQQMIVIGHQHISMDPPLHPLAGLPPNVSKKRKRSSSTLKMASRRSPRHITWYTAPGYSIRGLLGMNLSFFPPTPPCQSYCYNARTDPC